MFFLVSNILNERKGPSHSTSLVSCTTTHLQLQSGLALNFCTEQTEIYVLDSQVDETAFFFVAVFCVCAWC